MRPALDYTLIAVLAILIVLGILILAGVSASISQEKFGNPFYYLKHQILFGLIPGVVLGLISLKIPLAFLKKSAPILLLINFLLLALIFLPNTSRILGGASRWIFFGQISFQPSEFLKLCFLIYLAAWLTKQRKEKENLIGFFLILIPVIVLLFFQPDIGTLGLIVSVATISYFLADTPFWHTVLIAGLILVVFVFVMEIAPYRAERLQVFLRPETDPMGSGYQIKQALIAIGSGGIWGRGLGFSSQKLGFLPGTLSDSIFAILAEEAGFLGALILIALFLAFFIRGFKIVKKTKDKFSQILACGISSWIILQALINIGSMIGVLPLTGIPLPFISYGGSHLIAELIGVGILLNIGKR